MYVGQICKPVCVKRFSERAKEHTIVIRCRYIHWHRVYLSVPGPRLYLIVVWRVHKALRNFGFRILLSGERRSLALTLRIHSAFSSNVSVRHSLRTAGEVHGSKTGSWGGEKRRRTWTKSILIFGSVNIPAIAMKSPQRQPMRNCCAPGLVYQACERKLI